MAHTPSPFASHKQSGGISRLRSYWLETSRWAAAVAVLAATCVRAAAQPEILPKEPPGLEISHDGATHDYLLVRDVTDPQRWYYLGDAFRLQDRDFGGEKEPAFRLFRYDYRKGTSGGESLSGAILNFTVSWEAPPDVLRQLRREAARLARVAEEKIRLHPMPLTDLSISVRRAGAAKEGQVVRATTRAAYTVGDAGVTGTLLLESLEVATAEALISQTGLLVAVEGSYVGLSPGSKLAKSRVRRLEGLVGAGGLPESVKKRLVVDLPDWVSVAYLVPPDVDPDSGIDKVVIDVSLGDRDGKQKALRKSITWTPKGGWSEASGRLSYLSFPLSSLPEDLRKIPREELRFHVSLRIESRGDVLKLERTQAVIFGTDFLISGTLPVRVAEFRGTLLPWSKLSPGGEVTRVDITLRSGKTVAEGSMSPRRHNDEYGPPAPVRLIFLAGEGGIAQPVKAEVEFVLADGKRVPWSGNRQTDLALPFSIDFIYPEP